MTEFWYKKESPGRFAVAVSSVEDLGDVLVGTECDRTGYYRGALSREDAEELLRWLRRNLSPVEVYKRQLPPDFSKGELPLHQNSLYQGNYLRNLRKRPFQGVDVREALPQVSATLTVRDAQDEFVQHLEKDGTHCVLCGVFAKEYRRVLSSSMALGLLLVVEEFRRSRPSKHMDEGWLHIGEFFKSIPEAPSSLWGDFAKLRFWELVLQRPNDDPKKKYSGYWRPTKRGRLFVDEELFVARSYLEYNRNHLEFEEPMIDIHDALTQKYDYSDVMSWVR